ncbi:MAG TPA: hypothetical protein VKF59_10540, partial [Candidatus Dormibacteraeota bacterium]|nr:hypothetical protein [Candidatus Dormibacteraeota bacterium]
MPHLSELGSLTGQVASAGALPYAPRAGRNPARPALRSNGGGDVPMAIAAFSPEWAQAFKEEINRS